MQVKINGSVSEVADNSSIHGVLATRKLDSAGFIVALNGDIVPREQWESARVGVNDDIEIIRIVGGG